MRFPARCLRYPPDDPLGIAGAGCGERYVRRTPAGIQECVDELVPCSLAPVPIDEDEELQEVWDIVCTL
jgi:hypothetical protein